MNHTTDWTCRSCRAVLGQVRDGVLRPSLPVESVDGHGVARVPCPACGRVRRWESIVGPRTARPEAGDIASLISGPMQCALKTTHRASFA
jgi:hypothetical protein